MQGSNADVVPFLDGYAFRFHVFQYLLRLHLLIEAVFRYNHGRASVASLGFCVATLFYRILPSDALFFYIKKAAAFLQPPQHIFLFHNIQAPSMKSLSMENHETRDGPNYS